MHYECGCDNYNLTLGPGQNRSFQTSLCVSFGPRALKRPRAKRYAQLVWNDRYCPSPRAGLYMYSHADLSDIYQVQDAQCAERARDEEGGIY